jgi:hypothetical protein
MFGQMHSRAGCAAVQGAAPPSRAEIREGAEQALQQHLQQQRQADAGANRQQPRSSQPSAQGQLMLPSRSLSETDAARRELDAARRPISIPQPRASDGQWGAHPVQLAGRAPAAAAAGVRTADPQQQQQQRRQQQPPRPVSPELESSGAEESQTRSTGFLAWAGRVGGLRTGWV